MTLKSSQFNFVLKHIYFIRLEFDCSKIDGNIGNSWWEKSDKIDKSTWVYFFIILVIKNRVLRNWYS